MGAAVAGVLLLALLLSGGAHRLRELAAAIAQWAPGGIEEGMTVIVLTIVLMIILQAVEFPFAFYQGYLLEHRYGLSTQSTSHWMADQAKGVALGLVLAVAGTSVIYLALRESPDHWWWISAAVFALATIGLARMAPVVLLPIFYKFKPLDRPSLVDRLLRLARDARTRDARRQPDERVAGDGNRRPGQAQRSTGRTPVPTGDLSARRESGCCRTAPR